MEKQHGCGSGGQTIQNSLMGVLSLCVSSFLQHGMNSQRPKQSAAACCSSVCGPSLHNQWTSELSGCLCLKTQWTIQVESPSAHTPANTLHCCHCETQVLYKPSCHGKARRGKTKGGGVTEIRLGTRTAVSGCSERLLAAMWKTERLGEKRRGETMSSLLCAPPAGVYLAVCLQ